MCLGNLVAAFQYLKGTYRKVGDGLFKRAYNDRTRENGFKLKKGRYWLDLGRSSLTVRAIRQWTRLPRDIVDAPSWEGSRSVWWGSEQPALVVGVTGLSRVWNYMIFNIPSNTCCSVTAAQVCPMCVQ